MLSFNNLTLIQQPHASKPNDAAYIPEVKIFCGVDLASNNLRYQVLYVSGFSPPNEPRLNATHAARCHQSRTHTAVTYSWPNFVADLERIGMPLDSSECSLGDHVNVRKGTEREGGEHSQDCAGGDYQQYLEVASLLQPASIIARWRIRALSQCRTRIQRPPNVQLRSLFL